MTPKKCKYCDAIIVQLGTSKGSWTPVLFAAIKRGSDSTPLPKGTYYDRKGNRYLEDEVPNGVTLHRSHWGDCPGAKEARRR